MTHVGTFIDQVKPIILGCDNTQYTSTSTDWTTLKSYSVSSAQAIYKKIAVVFDVKFVSASNYPNGDSSDQYRISVDGSTAVGKTAVFAGLLGAIGAIPALPSEFTRTLEAGVHYTQGTAFTIYLQGSVVNSGAAPPGSTTFHEGSVVMAYE